MFVLTRTGANGWFDSTLTYKIKIDVIMELNEIKKQHAATKEACEKYVQVFAQIMGLQADSDSFAAGDFFGVVNIGDYYFNMSDIYVVISDFKRWMQKYGTEEALSNAIIEWYDYIISDPSTKVNLKSWLMGIAQTEEFIQQRIKAAQHRAGLAQLELEKAREELQAAKQRYNEANKEYKNLKQLYSHE